MRKITILFLVFFSMLFSQPVQATEETAIHAYLFYSEQCPHCKEEITWLNQTYENDLDVNLFYFEVTESLEIYTLFQEVQSTLETPARGVPYLVIGDEVIVGYLKGVTDVQIKDLINTYKKGGYVDPVGTLTKTRSQNIDSPTIPKPKDTTFKIPILKEINAEDVSLPLLAVVMGFVDGFNPCALWVLVFLITMLLQVEDRKKMWILGFIFILTSGFIYYLFMFTWLNFAMILSSIQVVKFIIASFAVIFGLVNIQRFIKERKKPGCDVIDSNRRSKIMNQIIDITRNKKMLISIFSIIALAIMVNLFELMCSLGLPVVFTQILSLNNLNLIQTQIYLLIYLLFFLIDDIIIFAIAMKTLKVKGISNQYTQYSHLIGGLIMLFLGLLMAFKPEWLMFNF